MPTVECCTCGCSVKRGYVEKTPKGLTLVYCDPCWEDRIRRSSRDNNDCSNRVTLGHSISSTTGTVAINKAGQYRRYKHDENQDGA